RRRRRAGHRGRRPPDQPLAPVAAGATARPGRRAAGLGGRRARLGLHLLLEPPADARGAAAVGPPRPPPLERALHRVGGAPAAGQPLRRLGEIGRASCRARVVLWLTRGAVTKW